MSEKYTLVYSINNEPSPKTSSKNPFIAARIQITKIITNKIMSIIEKSI